MTTALLDRFAQPLRNHRDRQRQRELALREPFLKESFAIRLGRRRRARSAATLVAQRLMRSGMRWRKACGSAIQTIRALIKSGLFDRTRSAPMVARFGPANRNISRF